MYNKFYIQLTIFLASFLSLTDAYSSKDTVVDSLKALLQHELPAKSRVMILSELGREYIFIDIFQAFDYARQSLELADSINYTLGKAHALRTLGSALGENRNYMQGVKMLLDALEVFKQENDVIGVANCYLSLGLLHQKGGAFDKSRQYELLAMDLYRQENNQERLGAILNNISRSHTELGNYDSARYYITEAIKINKNRNLAVLSSNYRILAIIHRHLGDVDKAEEYLNTVVRISDSLEEKANSQALAESHLVLGDIMMGRSRYADAEVHLKKTISIAAAHGYLDLLKKAYYGLFNLLGQRRDYEQSRSMMKEFIKVTDSILHIEQENRLEMVQWYYQNSLQRSQVDMLQKEKFLSDEIISRQRISIILLVVTIALAGLLIFVVVRNGNRQKKLSEKLAEANSTKNKLFSIISHDFRSPINSILGASIFLKNHADKLSKDDLRRMSEDMHKSILNTMRFTENILTWARSQMAAIKPNPVNFNLKQVVENVLEILDDQAHEKGVNVNNMITRDYKAYADKNQIETVIRNLINNAIKFSAADDMIKVAASEKKELIEVTVVDSGVGMSEEMLDNLFRIDTRNSTRGTSGEIGTGLGLIICKEFVENNAGELSVESRLGEGSVFKFTIPSSTDQ
ncbi:tetratricopeptide repeat-containing sensor histidine kinase [Fulvivirga ulvae]|uniref:ATP-binding protein n=1 Tax=Fulvivirga ulvae TaxID=2904245 RepID=UPI001F44C0CA|nr:tetratricopeptide repeat-containing sensor histidine kinase [Fulvivirga ulvae]UII31427.1 tetratricopeptide repeat-containing sensor histidine kinase [Fulvivirga ulvae]